ncbi:hypothetical protein lerEdw1_020919, partial [Lerista edwardsae]
MAAVVVQTETGFEKKGVSKDDSAERTSSRPDGQGVQGGMVTCQKAPPDGAGVSVQARSPGEGSAMSEIQTKGAEGRRELPASAESAAECVTEVQRPEVVVDESAGPLGERADRNLEQGSVQLKVQEGARQVSAGAVARADPLAELTEGQFGEDFALLLSTIYNEPWGLVDLLEVWMFFVNRLDLPDVELKKDMSKLAQKDVYKLLSAAQGLLLSTLWQESEAAMMKLGRTKYLVSLAADRVARFRQFKAPRAPVPEWLTEGGLARAFQGLARHWKDYCAGLSEEELYRGEHLPLCQLEIQNDRLPTTGIQLAAALDRVAEALKVRRRTMAAHGFRVRAEVDLTEGVGEDDEGHSADEGTSRGERSRAFSTGSEGVPATRDVPMSEETLQGTSAREMSPECGEQGKGVEGTQESDAVGEMEVVKETPSGDRPVDVGSWGSRVQLGEGEVQASDSDRRMEIGGDESVLVEMELGERERRSERTVGVEKEVPRVLPVVGSASLSVPFASGIFAPLIAVASAMDTKTGVGKDVMAKEASGVQTGRKSVMKTANRDREGRLWREVEQGTDRDRSHRWMEKGTLLRTRGVGHKDWRGQGQGERGALDEGSTCTSGGGGEGSAVKEGTSVVGTRKQDPVCVKSMGGLEERREDFLRGAVHELLRLGGGTGGGDKVTGADAGELITAEEVERMVARVTAEEVKEAIRKGRPAAAPGADGLPYGFYRLFEEHLAEPLAEVYNAVLMGKKAPGEGFLRGMLRLLPKEGDVTLVSNWRPLTLMNVDYRLLARVLLARLMPVAERLVHPSQTSAVPGRHMGRSHGLMREVFGAAQAGRWRGLLVQLDQSKAFDRVGREYLWTVMREKGIPEAFVGFLKVLYGGAQVVPVVGGWSGRSLPFETGLRQGCPLSALLYVIALDPLLRAIQADRRLGGFVEKAGGRGSEGEEWGDECGSGDGVVSRRAVVIAHADDICVILRREGEMMVLKELLELYGRASGALVNMGKSKCCALGVPWQQDMVCWPLSGKQGKFGGQRGDAVKVVKVLGVPFGLAQDVWQYGWVKWEERVNEKLKCWSAWRL